MVWILFSAVFACQLPPMPPDLDLFYSEFENSGNLFVYGNFLPVDQVYSLFIQSKSWVRILVEPSKMGIEVELHWENNIEKGKSYTGNRVGLGKIVEKGEIRIKFVCQTHVREEDLDNSACDQASLYLNIGIINIHSLPGFKAPANNIEFPDISEVFDCFNSIFPCSKTFPSFSIPTSSLERNLYNFQISVPPLNESLKSYGYSGLWEFTYSLCNL